MVLRDKYVMKAWLLKMHMNFVLKYHIENISWRPCNCSAFQVIWCKDTIFEQMSKDRKNMSTKIKCLDKFWRNSHILDSRGSLKDALIAADNYNSTGRSVVLKELENVCLVAIVENCTAMLLSLLNGPACIAKNFYMGSCIHRRAEKISKVLSFS